MKQAIFYLFILSLLPLSCQKEDDNGDLYGQWQLIYRTPLRSSVGNGQESVKENKIYWKFQLRLLEMNALKSNVLLKEGVYARFHKEGDSLKVEDMYTNTRFANDPLPESDYPLLEEVGLKHPHTAYKIEALGDKVMKLRSEDYLLSFRKF